MKESDQLIAVLNIIKTLSDFRGFGEWLRHHHKITDHDPFLEGYKYLIVISIQCLIETLFYYDPFGLKKDRILARAHFVGIPLEDIPNSCEKTVFCKNIWLLTKNIRKTKSWDKITDEELKEVTKLLSVILDGYAETKLNDENEALKAVTMFYAHDLLVDVSHGYPKAALGSFFDAEVSPEYLESVFNGYAYGVQYLWYKILSKEGFENSSLKDLHRSEQIFGSECQEYVDNQFSYYEFEDSIGDFQKKVLYELIWTPCFSTVFCIFFRMIPFLIYSHPPLREQTRLG